MKKYILIGSLALFSVLVSTSVFAQTACPASGPEKDVCESRLREELKKIEEEIKANQEDIKKTQSQARTLNGDIRVLSNKINESSLKIKSHGIFIGKLSGEIGGKESEIRRLDDKLGRQRESLAQIVRKSDELSNTSIVEFALQKKSLSDFFANAQSYKSVQIAMADTFVQVTETKKQTEEVKEVLEDKKDEQETLKTKQEVERKKADQNKRIKNQVLQETKQEEAVYQKLLKEKEAKAAQIRNALFALRDSGAIKFGDALTYAQGAFEATGVRPAFILAILTQESNLGKNTGRCYLKNSDTGTGVNTAGTALSRVMNPTRDVPPFLAIAKDLGFDPYTKLISCPLDVGWGGAMGPAQFIPSTWNGYKTKVASALGKSAANPWNARDAVFASAFLHKDNGAISNERNAACRYYSGRSCSSISNFYGNSVVRLADKIQREQIDPLQGL